MTDRSPLLGPLIFILIGFFSGVHIMVWFPKGWFGRCSPCTDISSKKPFQSYPGRRELWFLIFLDAENREEGTLATNSLLQIRPLVSSWTKLKTPYRETTVYRPPEVPEFAWNVPSYLGLIIPIEGSRGLQGRVSARRQPQCSSKLPSLRSQEKEKLDPKQKPRID